MFWPALVFALPFFVIPALMPGWRSLASAVIIGGAIILLLLIIGLLGGGAAQFLGLAAILLAIPCLACGALSGFMRLALSRHVMSLPGKTAIAIAPPALLFAAFLVLHRNEDAKWTLPDKACIDSVIPFVIGTSRIELPMLTGLSLYPYRNPQEAMYLHLPWVMRDLCQAEETRRRLQAVPLRLSAILADPSKLERAPEILRRSACDRSSLPNWMNDACRPDSGRFPAIREVGILSLPEIDGAFFGVSGTTYAEYLSATGRLQPIPNSGTFLRARDNRFHVDYLIAEPGYWKDASGAPMSAACFSRQATENLSCRSTVKLGSGLALHFTFNARSGSFEADFRTADGAARSFVTMLGL